MPRTQKIEKKSPHVESPRDKFVAGRNEVANKIIEENGLGGVPYCAPSKAADYLLTFADPSSGRKFKGICYHAPDAVLDLSKIKLPIVKESSENDDGKFNPLYHRQRSVLQKEVLPQLKKAGIPIEKCESAPIDAFVKNNGFLSVFFYSYDKEKPLSSEHYGFDGLEEGRAFNLDPADPANGSVYMIGIYKDAKSYVVTFFHEIGHVLGLNHFPPNFGTFSESCGPEFYGSVKAIQMAMERNKCAVDTPEGIEMESVMFCSWPAYQASPVGRFSLPEGDKIAFKKQYDAMIKDASKPLPHKGKPRPPKVERLIETSKSQPLFPGLGLRAPVGYGTFFVATATKTAALLCEGNGNGSTYGEFAPKADAPGWLVMLLLACSAVTIGYLLKSIVNFNQDSPTDGLHQAPARKR